MKRLIGTVITLGLLPWVSADNLAITEFMSDRTSTLGRTGGWVELFNYGPATVNLTGWIMADEDFDSTPLPNTTIQPDDFIILTSDKDSFEAEWLNRIANAAAFEISFGSLDNDGDELLLRNAMGDIVWQLAYANDGAVGDSTYLSVDDFTVVSHGTKASPGIVRAGTDISGSLGYESHSATTESVAFTSTGGDIGSPLVGNYSSIPEPTTILLAAIAVGIVAAIRHPLRI